MTGLNRDIHTPIKKGRVPFRSLDRTRHPTFLEAFAFQNTRPSGCEL
jgi:hypothetical protein